MSTDIVVTGLGQRSSLGQNVSQLWESLLAARSGFKPLDVVGRFGRGLGAPLLQQASSPSERIRCALHSSVCEAIGDSGLVSTATTPALECPAVIGTNFGDSETYLEHGDYLQSARDVLAEVGHCGELWAVSTACASGVGALGIAFDLIRCDGADVVLACAYDVITTYNYGGLASLKALSPEVIRPFDKARNGTLLGEGAAALILERREHAEGRGATIYGEILGYGIANDGYHFTAPEPSGLGMRLAMTQALVESGLSATDIGHVNAHGTGTPHNDRIESSSIRAVFGQAAIGLAVTSIKSAIGHTMGAAGALELIATILSVRHGVVPPTLNHEESDPELGPGLDFVFDSPRSVHKSAAMSNSYGLWGCNSSVVVRRGDES
jgi:3-oxoacyl-[acyl-carrier-protein] synthase II